MIRWGAALVWLLALAACDCGREPVAVVRPDPAVPWTTLSRCLAGDETPTRELLARIERTAEVEDVSDVPTPPVPAGHRPAEETRNRPDDVRRWPRRCAHHARELASAFQGPDRELARDAAEELSEGVLGEALLELVDRGVGFHTVEGQEPIAPPPPPASPLPPSVRYLVGGRCVPRLVLADASVSPPRQVAFVACNQGDTACTFTGEALDEVSCEMVDEIPDRWAISETRVANTTFRVRRRGGTCRYEAGSDLALVGEAECGEGGTWARPCGSQGSLTAVFTHREPEVSRVVMWRQSAFELFDAPPDVGLASVSCDDGAVRFLSHRSRIAPVDTPRRTSDFRRPMAPMTTVESRRCTPEGCELTSSELESFGSATRVAALDQRALLIERVHREAGDGLLAGFSPVADLAGARRWIVESETGRELDSRLALATSPTAVVVLVAERGRGVFAIRFDADGGYDYLLP